jgi:hypothetical protein
MSIFGVHAHSHEYPANTNRLGHDDAFLLIAVLLLVNIVSIPVREGLPKEIIDLG